MFIRENSRSATKLELKRVQREDPSLDMRGNDCLPMSSYILFNSENTSSNSRLCSSSGTSSLCTTADISSISLGSSVTVIALLHRSPRILHFFLIEFR